VALPSYRIYRVARGGRLEAVCAFEAQDDAAAVARARDVQDGVGEVELWEGGRQVGRFSKLGVFSAGRTS
jgi:hypothetical protein